MMMNMLEMINVGTVLVFRLDQRTIGPDLVRTPDDKLEALV